MKVDQKSTKSIHAIRIVLMIWSIKLPGSIEQRTCFVAPHSGCEFTTAKWIDQHQQSLAFKLIRALAESEQNAALNKRTKQNMYGQPGFSWIESLPVKA